MAKLLPGVPEILASKEQQEEALQGVGKKNPRAEIYKRIDFDYFQFDASLAPALAELEEASDAGRSVNPLPFQRFRSVPGLPEASAFLIEQRKKILMSRFGHS